MRAAIFIDGAYLIKQLHEARLVADYSRVAEYLLAPLRKRIPLDLLRCYFYDCPPWVSERATDDERRRMSIHERFVAVLEDLDRWQVRLGKLERRRDGEGYTFSQKRVDVQLSVDLVRHAAAGHIQHAVLVAGDSDFIPAVAAAKESGVTLTLWCGRDKSPHKDLMVAADEVQLLDWGNFPRKAMRPVSQSSGGTLTGAAAQKASAVEGGDGEEGAGAVGGEAPRKKSRRGGRGRRRKNGASGEQAAAAPEGGAEVVELAVVRAAVEPEVKQQVIPEPDVVPAEASKKGRGRGSRAKPKAEVEAVPDAPTRASGGRAPRAEPAAARSPRAEPAAARPPRAEPAAARPPRAEPAAARPPRAEPVAEPADDIGNRAQPGDGSGKKRRGRRGGRGRRRGGGGGTPPAE